MILQDAAEEVMAIIVANPDKISRQLLSELGLSKDAFSFQKGMSEMFSLALASSYSSKKLNEASIHAYAIAKNIDKKDEEDLQLILLRCQELDSEFSFLKEKVQVFLNELKKTKFVQVLKSISSRLEEESSVNQILLEAKEKLSEIASEEKSHNISMKGYGSEFMRQFNEVSTDDSIEYPFKQIAQTVGNVKRGELHLIAGASGEGKSIILMNVIYHNMVYRHKNQLWVSLEMSKTQCMNRLISLHSTKFGYNLEHTKIKRHELSQDEVDKLEEVTRDLFDNPDYGHLFFTQDTTTVEEIFDEAEDINKFIPLDAIYIDYISLLEGKGSSDREVISKNFKKIKSGALGFAAGKAIPVISVHQISEQAKEKAEELGFYEFNFLADSSESRKSSDMILWLLRTQQHRESHEIAVGFTKVRDAEIPPNFSLFEQFEFCKAESIDSDIE